MKKSIQLFALLGIMLLSFSMKDQDAALKKSMDAGKDIYAGSCLACHLNEGQGIASVFPPLAKSDYLMEDVDRNTKNLIEGLSGQIEVNGTAYNGNMPASGLDDKDIADVLNYIMNSWGNKAKKMVTEANVKKVRADL